MTLFPNRRKFSVSEAERSITLGDGMHLTYQKPAAREQLAVHTQEEAGVNCLSLSNQTTNDWVRLCVKNQQSGNVLGVRILLRAAENTNPGPLPIRTVLSLYDESTGVRTKLATSKNHQKIDSNGWYVLSGLFLCHRISTKKRFDIMLDLPEESTIVLGAVETYWHTATVSEDMAEQLREDKARALSAFDMRKSRQQDLSHLASTAPVFLKDLHFTDHAALGFVISNPQIEHLTVTAGGHRHSCPLTRTAEITPGVLLACGFSVPFKNDPAGDNQKIICEAPDATFEPILEAARPPAPPQTLFFWPDETRTSPYQRLLYGDLEQTQARAGNLATAIKWLQTEGRGGQTILHLHWLHFVMANATTAEEADARRQAFVQQLAFFTRLGGILVWTIHNTVSDGAKFPETERQLGQDVADLATKIHVYSPRLLPILAASVTLPPAKLILQPHPSFIGVYPNYVPRQAARTRLELPQDATVLLFQGQIRSYQDVDPLIQAFHALQKDHPEAYLLIAGKPAGDIAPGALSRRYSHIPQLRIVEDHLPEQSLQWYYNACDWVVLPPTRTLTPGALLCALSFARPAIAPAIGMIPDYLHDGVTGILYEDQAPEALGLALSRALTTAPHARQAMERAAVETVEPLTTWAAAGKTLEKGWQDAMQMTQVQISFADKARTCQLLGADFPPTAPARTAIFILNYDTVQDAQRLIESLRAQDNQDFDIYVIDNASPNMWLNTLETAFPDVCILRLPENFGYAAGNNAGMYLVRELPYQFYWILNPDMVVSPQALDQHITAADTYQDIALFGPAIAKGEESDVIASAGSYVSFVDGVSTGHMYPGETFDVLPETPYTVDFVTGASVFLRSAVLKDIGYMPEDYFLYFEETHWFLNAKGKGFACMVVPDIRLAHHKRSSADGLPAKYYFYYYIRNYLLFYARMTGKAPEQAAPKLRNSFIANWLKNVKNRAPALVPLYTEISERAIQDGLAGLSGKFDLLSLEIDKEDLDATPSEPAPRADITISDSGFIGGTITSDAALQKAVLHVFVDNNMVARSLCQSLSSDDTQQTWECAVEIPPAYRLGKASYIELRFNGQPLPLEQPLVFLPRPEPRLCGQINGLKDGLCHGRAWDQNALDLPQNIEILHGGKVIARGQTGHFPADIPKGISRTAPGAFALRLPKIFANGQEHRLGLRLAQTDTLLAQKDVTDSDTKDAPPMIPADAALRRLYFERQLWLSQSTWEDLSIGQFESYTRHALAARYTSHPPKTTVSIILPVVTDITALNAAIKSVQAQSFTDWELLIVEGAHPDCTSDGIARCISDADDSRIRRVPAARQSGLAAARNAALDVATGEIIAYFDSPNIWNPEFLRIMTGVLTTKSDLYDAAYCAQAVSQSLQSDEGPQEEQLAVRMGPFNRALLENRNYIDLGCFLHHRSLFQRLGGFDTTLEQCADWEFILRYTHHAAPHFVPALLSSCDIDSASNLSPATAPSALYQRRLDRRIRAQSRQITRDAPLRPVDVVVLSADPVSVTPQVIARLQDIKDSLPAETDARILFYPILPTIGLSLPDDILCPAETLAPGGAQVMHALGARRTGADMVFLDLLAQPQPGWLTAFNLALDSCPQGGAFVSRHLCAGTDVTSLQDTQPFATQTRDICRTLDAQNATALIDPDLAPRENLLELSEAGFFCWYGRGDMLQELDGLQLQDDSLEAVFQHITTYLRIGLRQKLVYCAKVELRAIALS